MRGGRRGGALAAAVLGLALSWVFWQASRRESFTSPAGSDAPARVVLFAPNLTETACALGHAARVVAITDYCVWPPDVLERPRVGGMLDPHLERLAALAPDLLVLQGESAILRAFARQQSIPVRSVKMDDDVASILRGIARVDSLLSGGRPRASDRLIAEIRRDLDDVAARATSVDAPRVLLALGHEANSLKDLTTVGGGTFLSELVAVAGGESMFGDHRMSYFVLSLESLLTDPPDVALELRPGERLSEEEREAIRRVWATLGLSRTRVEVITFDGVLVPGPRIAESARCLQAAIHPGLGP